MYDFCNKDGRKKTELDIDEINFKIGGPKTIKGAGCILIDIRTSKYLVVQNPSGKFGFPKGHLKLNEPYLTGAFRELKEETGIDNKFKIRAFMVVKNVVYYIIITREFPLDMKNIITKNEVSNILWVNIFDLNPENTTIAIKTFIRFAPTSKILNYNSYKAIERCKDRSLDVRWTNAIGNDIEGDLIYLHTKLNYIVKLLFNINKKIELYKSKLDINIIVKDFHYIINEYNEFIKGFNLWCEYVKHIQDYLQKLPYLLSSETVKRKESPLLHDDAPELSKIHHRESPIFELEDTIDIDRHILRFDLTKEIIEESNCYSTNDEETYYDPTGKFYESDTSMETNETKNSEKTPKKTKLIIKKPKKKKSRRRK